MSKFISNTGPKWTGFGTDMFQEHEDLKQDSFHAGVPPGYYDDEEKKPKRRRITKANAVKMLREQGLDFTIEQLTEDGWPHREIDAITNVMLDEFAHAADGMATYGEMDTDDWTRK